MTSAHDSKPRAERGMELTLLAVKFQIALAILPLFFGLGIINVLALIAFYFGLNARMAWVALLFAAFCIFDFFGAIGYGFETANLLNLFDAILSFVAFCGIVIWFRREQQGASA